ncbi:cupin domain-containing protein [Streptomyces albulus]|uniref:cupin domain-containing protein n=1 Tax=Streptomyces noursei TaxID=1971 RepID=UPI001F2E47E5|nr:cupin domain-containing protein [Streptomyces noursei]MCE4947286.1 cupin domain-containing protein [Streptomyces noursei]
MTETTVSASAAALAITTQISALAVPLLRSQQPMHHEVRALDGAWFDVLPLPVVAAPTVTLINGTSFERVPVDDPAVSGPRTRSYENLHVHVPWIRRAAVCMERVVGRRVACAAYVSLAGDTSLGRHYDDWDGVIVQVQGQKRWRIWADPLAVPHEIVTRPGDLLVLRRGVEHEVSTPQASFHLAFAITSHSSQTGTSPLAG